VIAEWISGAAARQGGAPYLEDAAGTGTLTYTGLRSSTRAWADRLDRAGIPPGARVAVRLPDPLSYATAALVGILGAGRVVIPLDPGAPAAELSRVLAAARPQAAVGESDDGLPPGLAVLRPPDRSSGPNGPGSSPAAERAIIPAGASRTGGIFLCTSGTTGAPSVLSRFEEATGLPVIETYGMTEAASMITANPLDGPRKAGSAGRPVGTQVRVARLAAGRYVPCPARTVGRVQIRGRGVISEYAENGPAGAVDPEGWLDTGDLGHLDQDGYLFLAGRSDDVINRGGEKIYPREIEDVLLAQPGVRSAAVVAAYDEVLGERPVAYVVPTEPWPRELEDALRAACAAALPRPKRPSAFCLVRDLPLGPTGKVARRRLRELAAGRHSRTSLRWGRAKRC